MLSAGKCLTISPQLKLRKGRKGLNRGCMPLQVFILPTVRINNGQYRGKLAYAEVLRAICAGFSYGAEPSVCMQEDTCREGSQPDTDCKSR